MASTLKIFSLYKATNQDKYYLLRTERPSFSNVSQNEEDLAIGIEQDKRNQILELIRKTQNHDGVCLDFIGEIQECPIGDQLYADQGMVELTVYFMETEFGRPWIVLGNALTKKDFLTELYDDQYLMGLKPIGQVHQIKAMFITENDVVFSHHTPTI